MRLKRREGTKHDRYTRGVIDTSRIGLSHFEAMGLFAAVISVAFGFLSRRRPVDRLKYIAWSLFLFLVIGIGIGWVMYPFSR